MRAILEFFKSPYPIRTCYGRVWMRSILISIFVALFLLVFQPFGISSIEHDWKIPYILSFAIPCFIALISSGLIVVWIAIRWNWEAHWNVGYEILLMMLIPMLVGAANVIHNVVFFNGLVSIRGFLQMEAYTVAIAFFPIVGMIALDWLSLLRKHEKIASNVSLKPNGKVEGEIADSSQLFCFAGENQSETFSVDLRNLLFVKAESNYVNFVFVSGNGLVESFLLRSTLSAVEKALIEKKTEIVRCHRSFLVNLKHIVSVSGNAQGLDLSLRGTDQTVSVSRKYVPDFRALST